VLVGSGDALEQPVFTDAAGVAAGVGTVAGRLTGQIKVSVCSKKSFGFRSDRGACRVFASEGLHRRAAAVQCIRATEVVVLAEAERKLRGLAGHAAGQGDYDLAVRVATVAKDVAALAVGTPEDAASAPGSDGHAATDPILLCRPEATQVLQSPGARAEPLPGLNSAAGVRTPGRRFGRFAD
jgi:hypothetical protein